MDLSASDRDMIVRTVIGEAGSEPDEGKAAVASVILNRLKTGEYGDTASKVIQQKNAFEPWSTRRQELLSYSPESKAYQDTQSIVDSVISGEIPDVTSGATHFYSPGMQAVMGRPTPDWAKGQPNAKIGHHVFYAPNGPAQEDLLAGWGGNASAPAAVPATDSEDLLGSWGGKQATSASDSPSERLHIAVPATKTAPASAEPMPQLENLKAAQGDSWSDRGTRLGVGFLQGAEDVANTLARGIATTGEQGANALASAGIISPQTSGLVQNWAQGVRQNVLAERQAFDQTAGDSALASAGRIGGQIFTTAPALGAGEAALGIRGLMAARPVVGSVVGGAAAGAGANALTSSASDEPLASQVGEGAVAGGVLGPLGYGASRLGAGARNLIFGHLDPETAQLAQAARNTYGIPVTAGQISSSPAARFMDSVMQRLPFTGYGARSAEQQTAFNRAVSNSFGEDVDHITQPVLRNARDRIGQAFDDVAARTGNIQLDQPFLQHLNTIWNDAQSVLPQSEQGPLRRQLIDLMSSRDPATNTISGETYQALTRKGAPLDRSLQSADPNIRHYAGQMREALDDVLQRSAPPDVVQDLQEARRQWRALKTVEKVATPKKAPTGDVRPALLASEAARSYPRGGTPLADLSSIGQRFLTEPPSSGTAERLMAMKGIGAAVGAVGGLGGAYAFDPDNFQRNALLGGLALAGGRVGSSVLRSNWLANSMIRGGLPAARGAQPALDFLVRTAPFAALTYRGNTNALASQ